MKRNYRDSKKMKSNMQGNNLKKLRLNRSIKEENVESKKMKFLNLFIAALSGGGLVGILSIVISYYQLELSKYSQALEYIKLLSKENSVAQKNIALYYLTEISSPSIRFLANNIGENSGFDSEMSHLLILKALAERNYIEQPIGSIDFPGNYDGNDTSYHIGMWAISHSEVTVSYTINGSDKKIASNEEIARPDISDIYKETYKNDDSLKKPQFTLKIKKEHIKDNIGNIPLNIAVYATNKKNYTTELMNGKVCFYENIVVRVASSALSCKKT